MGKHDHTNRQLLLTTAVFAAAVLVPSGNVRGDDTELFRTTLPPNVLLLMDSSGSMNGMMYHKAWPGGGSATCDVIPSTHSGTSDIRDDNNKPVRANCGGSGCRLEVRSGTYYSDFVATSGLLGSSKSGYIERTFCGQTRKLYHDGNAEDRGGDSDYSRWFDPYIDWYFGLDPADTTTTYGPDNQTAAQILTEIDSDTNGQKYIGGTTYPLYKRSRMTAAAEVADEVMYRINSSCPAFAADCGVYTDRVRFGIAQFAPSSHGGYVRVPIDDYAGGGGNRSALGSVLDAIDPGGSTPLGESLFKLYTYFMSRTASERPKGDDGITVFPGYDYSMTNGAGDAASSLIPPDPVDVECRQNFVIVLTDGEPGSDDFYTSGTSTDGFGSFDALIGDYAPDATGDADIGTDSTPEEGPPWIDGRGAGYLDDVALFMQQNDMRPVEWPTSTQKVDVYTIGFGTTGAAVGSLLQKTATNGNGIYKQGSQSDELVTALIDSLSDIIEKTQSFAAASVPSSRTSTDNHLYYSYFIPGQENEFWEGHLKDFVFSPAGDILEPGGNCAVGDDATATAPCPTNGIIRADADGHWDVATVVPTQASRGLYVGEGAVTPFTRPTAWSTANMAAADLALVAGDLSVSPYTAAADLEDLADKLVMAFRGCAFGTSCTERTNSQGVRTVLGDTFHSNPLVIGNPNSAINESSYRTFSTTYRDRDRILYTGVNDGFLHGFHAGDWHIWVNDDGVTPLIPPRYDEGTGIEQFGFMPSEIRRTLRSMLADGEDASDAGPDHLTVDGTPVAADIWMYRDFTSGGSVDPVITPENKTLAQWRTVLMGGLRGGGRSYYALDVTNPAAATYPGYLWEFPCDPADCASAMNSGVEAWEPWMGQTWSEPVITRVRVKSDTGTDPRGYERWVAIFGAGYDEDGDPNDTDYDWDPTTASTRGRAIFMVDITTGKVLAVKHFSDTAVLVNGTQRGYPEMRYAIASAPAVFDLDFDGFADIIYIGDVGGNLWKWVVTDLGDDPVNNTTADMNEAQPSWPFRIVFRGSASTEPPAHHSVTPADPSGTHFQSFFFPPTGVLRKGTLLLAFGAGERAAAESFISDATDTNNNHYYVLRDSDPYENNPTPPAPLTGYLGETDLATNAELDSLDCNTLHATKDGYAITAREAEKFVTNSIIFAGELITGSFIPPDPNITGACTASGTAYIYRFDVDCGGGAYPSNPGSGNEDRRRALGGGMPTRPRVSVGSFNQGGGGGGCENRVVVITSDGAVDNDCAGSPPSSGTSLRSWRSR